MAISFVQSPAVDSLPTGRISRAISNECPVSIMPCPFFRRRRRSARVLENVDIGAPGRSEGCYAIYMYPPCEGIGKISRMGCSMALAVHLFEKAIAWRSRIGDGSGGENYVARLLHSFLAVL